MAQDINNLIWIDMEMSGLSPQTDRILEVALVITNSELDTIAEAPVLVIFQSEAVLDAMDSWNKSTHAKSGLIDKVRSSRPGGGGSGRTHDRVSARSRSPWDFSHVR